MTFAQTLHRVLDYYFGDEAFERRDQKQIEKIKETLRPEIYEREFEAAFAVAWADVPESIRVRLGDDGKERIRQRILAKRVFMGGIDAKAA